MYLLVTVSECQELLELSYACSSCSLKNGETWFDKDRWQNGLRTVIGEETFASLPKEGTVDIIVYHSTLPEKRLVDKLPDDPVRDYVAKMMETMRVLEPGDFFKELTASQP